MSVAHFEKNIITRGRVVAEGTVANRWQRQRILVIRHLIKDKRGAEDLNFNLRSKMIPGSTAGARDVEAVYWQTASASVSSPIAFASKQIH